MNMPLYDIYFKTCAYISIFFIHAVFYQINDKVTYYVQNYVQLIVGIVSEWLFTQQSTHIDMMRKWTPAYLQCTYL